MDSAALVGVNPSFNQGMKDNLMPTDKEVEFFLTLRVRVEMGDRYFSNNNLILTGRWGGPWGRGGG